MWRKRPRAGDVDVSASKVSLLEVPAMAISSATPGNGCGRTCQRLRWTLTRPRRKASRYCEHHTDPDPAWRNQTERARGVPGAAGRVAQRCGSWAGPGGRGIDGGSRTEPDAIYTSDLLRAKQTADEVAKLTGHEVHTDERLREIHCGSWHGRSIDEVSQELPQLVEFRRSGQDFRRSDTGETAAEVADRVCEALFDIIKDNKNQTVMIVSHGLAIRVGIARLLGLPDELSTKLGTLQNCRYALVSQSKRRVRLSAYNLPG